MVIDQKTMIYAGIGAGALLLYWLYRRGVQDAAATAASGLVSAADGIFVGSIQGVGQVFGIQPTDQTQCQKDLAAGKTWDASFSCPAGTWLKAVTGF